MIHNTLQQIIRFAKRFAVLLPDRRLFRISASDFYPARDLSAQKEYFLARVSLIEIEVHSYCNRRCWFCPNAFIDRTRTIQYLDGEMYRRLVEDLGTAGYGGMITFSRYCEPFADRVFYERLSQARRAVPDALLHTNTNGDYLDAETLERSFNAGLRSLNIQIYLEEEDRFCIETVAPAAERIQKRIPAVRFSPHRERIDWIEYRSVYKDMKISMYARDFRVNGVNRGGLKVSAEVKRVSPCLQPFFCVYIDYTGEVVPCCNIRGDIPEHRDLTLGRIDASSGSIFRIFSGAAAAAWRKRLIPFALKSYPCAGCSFDVVRDNILNRYFSSRHL
ncbi:MAG: radical SAM/SPASM domain-containing protein [Candidatus Omnitrophota bacterium]